MVIVRSLFTVYIVIVVVTVMSACQTTQKQTQELVYVYIASSLERVVIELNQIYEHRYPHRKVISAFAGSHTARIQLERGAPAGIFISADSVHIDSLKALQKVSMSTLIAYNHIALLTQSNSKIESLSGLLNGQSLGVGVKQVPIGKYAWRILKAYEKSEYGQYIHQLSPKIITQELSARALMGRLARREVQSAFLYQSDIVQLKDVRKIHLPTYLEPLTKVALHMAITRDGVHSSPTQALKDWYELILSDEGKSVMRSHRLVIP
jgi:molybdate transport system substrate-binding protein